MLLWAKIALCAFALIAVYCAPKPKPTPAKLAKPVPLIAEVTAWASERVRAHEGKAKAGPMQQDFGTWANSKGLTLPNNWNNQWGDAMAALGYEKRGRKEGSAYVVYMGISLKDAAPTLKVVKA